MTSPSDPNAQPKYSNRLVGNSSPYLRQHAHNPIDWYPWGREAFEIARAQARPIFLSVGYSTCHWCHVMERETFSDEQIARYLNDHFVCIKLDREQRPDLDEIYMTGLQLMTGQGGWPMSIFMTPEGKPFFTGTYLAPGAFTDLARAIQKAWLNQRQEVMQQAEQIHQAIAQQNKVAQQAKIDQGVVQQALNSLLLSFDEIHGGFGRAPKFPNESQLWLIWQCATGDADELPAAFLYTLRKMAQGGIFDQLAGGFHRYSVDAQWLVPHFEKMLYNQGQLLRLYAAAYQQSGEPQFLRTICDTLDYLRREMVSEEGGFYAATDADSEGAEGKFFTWTFAELSEQLTVQERALAQQVFGVSERGNFDGTNVLFINDAAQVEAQQALLAPLRQKLLAIRDRRVKPFRDEKIIAAWNGLAIASIAQVELLTDVTGYRDLAVAAANNLWAQHVDSTAEQLVLWRSRLEGTVSVAATLEDFAYVADGFMHLALLTNDSLWLARGEQLLSEMHKQFWDNDDGGYFASSSTQDGPMIVRTKNAMDAAMPSGNSAALSALILAYEATGELTYKQRIEQLIATFSGSVALNPMGHPYFLAQTQRFHDGNRYLRQWACGGRVWLAMTYEKAGWQLDVKVASGWHLNHPEVSGDAGLFGLSITGAVADYPSGRLLQVSFHEASIPVLEGAFHVPLAEVSGHLTLQLQLCSDEVCLAPQTVLLPDPRFLREHKKTGSLA